MLAVVGQKNIIEAMACFTVNLVIIKKKIHVSEIVNRAMFLKVKKLANQQVEMEIRIIEKIIVDKNWLVMEVKKSTVDYVSQYVKMGIKLIIQLVRKSVKIIIKLQLYMDHVLILKVLAMNF